MGRWGQAFLLLLAPVFVAAIAATYTPCVDRPGSRRRPSSSGFRCRKHGAACCWSPLPVPHSQASCSSTNWSISSAMLAPRLPFLRRVPRQLRLYHLEDVPRPSAAGRGLRAVHCAGQRLPCRPQRDLELESVRGQPNHNTFFSLLTETGLIGVGLFTAMLFGWTRSAWRLCAHAEAPEWARRQGLLLLGGLASFAAVAMFFDTTFSPEDHWMIFFLAGLTVGIERATFVKSPAGSPAHGSPDFVRALEVVIEQGQLGSPASHKRCFSCRRRCEFATCGGPRKRP